MLSRIEGVVIIACHWAACPRRSVFVEVYGRCSGSRDFHTLTPHPPPAGARPYRGQTPPALVAPGIQGASAPGHNAVIVYDNRTYNVYHALAAPSGQNGTATLRIAEMVWDANGWPVSGGP